MSFGRLVLVTLLLLAIAGLLAAMFVPLPRTVRCEYELVPAGKFAVVAPYAGTLLEVADAGAVEDDAVLARYDLSKLEQRRVEIEAEREALVKKLEGEPIPPELLEAVARAEANVKQAREDLSKASKKMKPYAKAVLGGRELELAKAKEAALPIPSAQLEEPLAKLNAQLAEISEQLAASTIDAPHAGAFSPSVKAGDTVTPKQLIGELIDSSTLLARVKLPDGEVAKKDRLLTLIFPLARKTYALTEDGKEGFVAVEVINSDGALKAGAKGTAELEGEQRPYIAP